MRDIPKINYNTSTKTRGKIDNESGNVITKCSFRSYKDFLENYDGNKNSKDDQESVSSTDSGISESKSYNTSTSSLNSESNGTVSKITQKIDAFSNGRTGSFRNYLEHYNNKKFSSVKPLKPVVKSEIVIQVNAPEDEERDVPDCLPPPPPPPPLMFTPIPPPPPLPLLPCAAKKWEPVQVEAPAKVIAVPHRTTSASSNLAAVLTQNALFKRKANESETVVSAEPPRCVAAPPNVPRNNTLPRAKAPEFVNHRTITVELPFNSPPRILNDVDYNTTTVVPITDKATKVKTNDPNVKKMVYSTYRGLLGAYNNKANDMIATLPRTMVREDRGIAKQLESITLQGGVAKLNGRTNPKVEME